MNHIREARMGPANTWKTGAVVGTYPRPLLVLEGDEHGLSVIRDPVEVVDTAGLRLLAAKPREALPPLTAVYFDPHPPSTGSVLIKEFGTVPDKETFPVFVEMFNVLFDVGCPWKTVVLDPLTRLNEIVQRYHASVKAGELADPRKWASSIGQKVAQVVYALKMLECHIVVILHASIDKDELTGQVSYSPMLYSRFRDSISNVMAQFVFAKLDKGQAVVLTRDDGYVTGLGCKWPTGLPAKVGPTFNDIYGNAVKTGETYA